MTKRPIFKTVLSVLVLTLSLLASMGGPRASAASSSLIISEVLVNGAAANQEFIELYNSSSEDIDLEGYIVRILSSNKSTLRAIPLDSVLEAHTNVLITSATYTGGPGDFHGYSGAMSSSGGHVILYDADGLAIDTVGWGEAEGPETTAAPSPPDGSSLARVSLQDTDDNSSDFTSQSPTPQGGGLYALEDDLCPNINGLQESIPDGLTHNELGWCVQIVVDFCPNIEGTQSGIPPGYYKNQAGLCLENQECVLEISEISAQPNYNGKEYVEVYNPTEKSMHLNLCTLIINEGAPRMLPEVVLQPGERYVLEFTSGTIRNSAGQVTLVTSDNVQQTFLYPETVASQSVNYGANRQATITNYPTPAEVNAENPTEENPVGGQGAGVLLSDCGPGKYRHPETNRCRNLESDEASLTPCAADQERNPATNRCRKVAAVSVNLTPCKPGQERNPETNRCKQVADEAGQLKPCEPGQERNPETNRCRKIASAVSGTSLESAAQPAALSPFKYKWPIIGLLSAGLLGYGIYEYRTDVRNYLQKVRESRRRGRPPG